LADPYWAKLWPAAPLLAEAIVRRGATIANKRTLELGCGSGLVGIAALACGYNVTFSDYVPLAVDLAIENAARNGFSNAAGLVLDWRRPAGERFDFLVAADVTYDQTNLDHLLNVVETMLVPGGEAWFGDAGRSPATDFVEKARQRGFAVQLFDATDASVSDIPLGAFRRVFLSR
jgi:predicted nicotinamide N-methyase